MAYLYSISQKSHVALVVNKSHSMRTFLSKTYPEKDIEKEEKILHTTANFCSFPRHR